MDSKKDEVKIAIQDLGQLLSEAHEMLSKQRGSYQSINDILSGSFRTPSGILLPLRIHKFVYENYDLFVLRAYCQLFQKVLQAENEIFILTTLRILQELGIKKIDIFFSGVLSPEEHAKARLVSVLSDWVMLSRHSKYVKYFKELFKEEYSILDKSGQKIFSDISIYLNSSSNAVPILLSKKMKRYRESIFGEHRKKIPILTFLKGPNLESLFSYLSELLHGNPLMLEQIFNEKLHWKIKNRLYAFLWFTGQHALRRIQPQVQEKEVTERITNIITKAEDVWRLLVEDWELEGQKQNNFRTS